MGNRTATFAIATFLFTALAIAVATFAAATQAAAQTSPDVAARGKAVFDAAGCLGCHTEKGGAELAGGGPLATPFGTFYAPNITPDPDHGIGRWSEADFVKALREGTSPGGSPYFPVFPYSSFTRMTAQDISDLWAYLRTVPPSAKPSRAHDVPFPFSIRLALVPWKWMFFSAGEYMPDPRHDAAWNRGAYIVEALTHCGECHTPRNAVGALQRDLWLSGARMPVGDLIATNLTPDRTGIINWKADDLVAALKTGELPEGGTLGGEMGEVVANSTSKMSDYDLKAIVAYLKALPPLATIIKRKSH